MTSQPAIASASGTPPGATTLPAAVLWDMDGTLIDTEPYWMSAETELVEAHGGVWTREDALGMVGSSMAVCARTLRSRGVALPDEEISGFLNARVAAGVAAGIPWQPGARELLDALVAAGVPLALVTSSYAVLAEPFARAAGVFDVVVSGDEVTHPKPHPEPYLTAAERLGVDVRDCVAVEDSRSGVASAHASGARTLAVQVVAPVEAPDGVSITDTLRSVSLGVLTEIVTGRVVDLRGADAPADGR